METLLSRAEIPIIDLAHMGTAEAPVRSGVRRVGAQLHRALSERGLALLVNHGIPEERFRALYKAFDCFCELPLHERRDFLHRHASVGDKQSYVPPGSKRSTYGDVNDGRHEFNMTSLDEVPFQDGDDFVDASSALAEEFLRLATLLLRALASGLGQQSDFFLRWHARMLRRGNASCVRTHYYPTLGLKPDSPATRRPERADFGTFTLLAQDSEAGLEVKLPNGRWGRVGHLPGAILINTGEVLDIWTERKYTALCRRMVVCEQEAARCRSRHTVAFFVHPDDETPIVPLALSRSAVDDAAATSAARGRGLLARLMSAPAGKPTPNNSPIYTASQHLQMRLRGTYAA